MDCNVASARSLGKGGTSEAWTCFSISSGMCGQWKGYAKGAESSMALKELSRGGRFGGAILETTISVW